MLDTRGSGPVASRLKWLTVENFSGNNGDGTFNVHGLSFFTNKKSDTLRILLVNHRPSIDPVTGEFLDSSQVGANSTIEHFLTQAGSSSIRHVRTHAHPLIQTPNAVAWVSDHSFVVSNDHSVKVGFVSIHISMARACILTFSAPPTGPLHRGR
jgi:arylesterase / paraoxonase